MAAKPRAADSGGIFCIVICGWLDSLRTMPPHLSRHLVCNWQFWILQIIVGQSKVTGRWLLLDWECYWIRDVLVWAMNVTRVGSNQIVASTFLVDVQRSPINLGWRFIPSERFWRQSWRRPFVTGEAAACCLHVCKVPVGVGQLV